jgi:hypothetical protein
MIKRIFSLHTIPSSIVVCIMLLCDVMLYAWFEAAISMCSLSYCIVLFFREHSFTSLTLSALSLCALALLYHGSPFIPLAYIIPLFIAHYAHARRYVVRAWPTYALTICICLCIHTLSAHLLCAQPLASYNATHLLGISITSLSMLTLLTSTPHAKRHR